ncbi:MAG: haloacid dehalogenase type II [Gammaproteobacteria bacterium]|nr:haloacid dehalogenase type II [Gammaproteobacteria bacterium]
MTASIAFDVYGTLIDPLGISNALKPLIGKDKAHAFSETWRSKQLEYTFRRGLMRSYEEFPVCTRQALDYCCLQYNSNLDEVSRRDLMKMYQVLPAYDDVEPALRLLQDLDVQLFAFSNGVERDIQSLLENANLTTYFEGIVSVDEVQSFKPDPEVYNHFLKKTRSESKSTWLVSGNPFDILGAISAGWESIWLQRQEKSIFDPWNEQASEIIKSLDELAQIQSFHSHQSGR